MESTERESATGRVKHAAGTFRLSRTRQLLTERNGEGHRDRADIEIIRRKEGLREICFGRISESHNEEYYAVEDQRFLGEEGFGEELSREAGEKEERKTKVCGLPRQKRCRLKPEIEDQLNGMSCAIPQPTDVTPPSEER